ncbi:COP9 signalosome (CSN) subunit [Ascosphaera aggregata]|nr:COP9 signalosome (CSN) subunit [Ascosphaera aggregata]
MTALFAAFKAAHLSSSGSALSQSLSPAKTSSELNAISSFTDAVNAVPDIRFALTKDRETGLKLTKHEANAWVDVYVAYWRAAGELISVNEYARSDGSWTRVFNAWKDVANALTKGYTIGKFPAWTIPCLYVVGKYLRVFAMKADAEPQDNQDAFDASFQDDLVIDSGKNARLEETSRIINRMFTLCLQDRSLLHAIDATQFDMPPLEDFPKSHIVTYKYFVGLMAFLEERYTEAEEHLTHALKLCHRASLKNKELILNYLIPCHMVTTHTLPTKNLLSPYPRLERLFLPLCRCIKKGDLTGFDAEMATNEHEFVKRKIYLPLERGRDLALRNLFRRVFIAGGFDPPVNGQPPIRRTRIPVKEFVAAMRLGRSAGDQEPIDTDEVECFLANLIYKVIAGPFGIVCDMRADEYIQ